jgi:hypothetical protein
MNAEWCAKMLEETIENMVNPIFLIPIKEANTRVNLKLMC